MKYRKLGRYGLRLSEVSLGAWLTYGGSVEDSIANACIHKAIELGVNFIDVADVYAKGQAEKVVGNAISGDTYNRKDLVVSSKVFWPMSKNPNDVGLSRKHIMDSIEGSLDRLGTDYLDIYFCHRFDWLTPLEETILTMTDLIEMGLIRYWGTSVWSAAQLERAMGIVKELGAKPPAVEQPKYNLLERFIELEVMNTTEYHGMGIVPFSPLGGGILTGKYNNGIPNDSRAQSNETFKARLTEEDLQKVRKLSDLAKELDITTSQLSLAWILRRNEISSVITGATKPEHVEKNVEASDVTLSKDTLEHIEDIFQNKPQWPALYTPQILDRE